MPSAAETWLVPFRTCAAPRARLFCLPYAGGSSTLYAKWPQGLPADVEVFAVELAGRGRRRHEPCATDMASAVRALAQAMVAHLDRPVFLFGHSLGAVLAFALAGELGRVFGVRAAHLVASARAAPDRSNPDRAVARTSEAAFVEALRRRGGMAPEILADPDLMALFVPIIRADFLLMDSYVHAPAARLDVPLTVFAGTRDPVASPRDMDEWRAHSTGPFASHVFEGDHFFVNTQREAVLARVAGVIASTLAHPMPAAAPTPIALP